MEIKSVGIIGLGALGIMYGQKLEEHPEICSVYFIADENRINKYKKQIYFCNGKVCKFNFKSPGNVNESVDLLIFAVKFSGLQSALKTVEPFVGEKTICLSVMNGITSEEYIGNFFGPEKTLLCTVQGMDTVKEENKIEYGHIGNFAIGTKDGIDSENLECVKRFFDKVGLVHFEPKDMNRQLWNKLLLNDGINQSVAIYETNYGGIQKPGIPRDTMINAMKEVVSIAQAKHINLTNNDIEEWLKLIDTLSPKGMPSMRQDTRAGRKTEVELFSGTIIKYGKETGIPTPVNEMLYKKLIKLQQN